MSATKTDYEGVAEAIRAESSEGYEASLDGLVERLCAFFASRNPSFDPGRFRRACQP